MQNALTRNQPKPIPLSPSLLIPAVTSPSRVPQLAPAYTHGGPSGILSLLSGSLSGFLIIISSNNGPRWPQPNLVANTTAPIEKWGAKNCHRDILGDCKHEQDRYRTTVGLAARSGPDVSTLSPDQIERVATPDVGVGLAIGGCWREAERPERFPFFVITQGEVEIVRPSSETNVVIGVWSPGQFAGAFMLRPAYPWRFACCGLRQKSSRWTVNTTYCRSCRPTSKSVGIIMRAFILRRLGLIEGKLGDVVVVGRCGAAHTLQASRFPGSQQPSLTPYVDLDRDADVPGTAGSLPSASPTFRQMICRGGLVASESDSRTDRG